MTDALLVTLADASMRSVALVASLALVLALCRVRSSAARHAAWTAALVAMLLMPVLSRVVPAVSVAVPRGLAWGAAADPAGPGGTPPWDGHAAPVAGPIAAASGSVDAVEGAAASSLRKGRPEARPLRSILSSWRSLLAGLYLAGVAFVLVRLLVGWRHLSRIWRSSRPVVVPAAGELFESPSVATPATIGLLAPRVVLPSDWRAWRADMLAGVVAHERAHASRRDPLIAFLARLTCAVYWFHPVSWWLARRLSILAEHACDDAATEVVARRRYAETLLEIAASVRRHRGRFVWHGVGVDGDGRLGRRIDRVLAPASSGTLSRGRAALLATSCAVVIAGALACRPQAPVEPLREDPLLAAELKAQEERRELDRAARRMTLEEAEALERVLEQNPEDMATRERLLAFYRWTGSNKQEWNDNVAARRRHALWLIEHHPESELVLRPRVLQSQDPEGYAAARRLWLEAIAEQDASPIVLLHAASFFAESERRLAADVLRRGEARQPGGPSPGVLGSGAPSRPVRYPSWSQQLGRLYVSSIVGPAADGPDAEWARAQLEASADAHVLYSAGSYLASRPADPAIREFGSRLLERAAQLDENIARQVRALEYQRLELSPPAAFGSAPRASWEGLLATSTGVQKLRQLVTLAEFEYMAGEYRDWISRQPDDVRRPAAGQNPVTPEQDRKAAAEMFARSHAYARQAIDLARSLDATARRPDLQLRAHHAAGLHALREGNREETVAQLREASRLPVSVPSGEPWVVFPLEHRLVNYLLKNGERTRVVEYLERTAPHRAEAQRQAMLEAAAAIREGRMPEHYQRLLASGSL